MFLYILKITYFRNYYRKKGPKYLIVDVFKRKAFLKLFDVQWNTATHNSTDIQEAQFRAVENWAALKAAALTMEGKPHTLPFLQPEEMS